ncbi:MAG: zinc ribbon domain-containing protein [Firmicutes bacterium]|nr:zinc ribbon domain-containing protein [Bacillota bacterium]
MEIKAIYCPACGAPLRVNIENPITYCQYCGSQLRSDGTYIVNVTKTYNHNYTYRDESRIKEAEVKQVIRQKELANQAVLTPMQLQQQERIRMKELEVKKKQSDNKAIAAYFIGFFILLAVIAIFAL